MTAKPWLTRGGGFGNGRPIRERIAEKTERTAGCWLWHGAKDSGGRPIMTVIRVGGKGQVDRVARVVFRLEYGADTSGLDVHHECRNRGCVRPDHLRLLTSEDHSVEHAVEACPSGHPYDEENTRWRVDGGRACRACDRDRQRERRQERCRTGASSSAAASLPAESEPEILSGR